MMFSNGYDITVLFFDLSSGEKYHACTKSYATRHKTFTVIIITFFCQFRIFLSLEVTLNIQTSAQDWKENCWPCDRFSQRSKYTAQV